jgi:hypothetical protein
LDRSLAAGTVRAPHCHELEGRLVVGERLHAQLEVDHLEVRNTALCHRFDLRRNFQFTPTRAFTRPADLGSHD